MNLRCRINELFIMAMLLSGCQIPNTAPDTLVGIGVLGNVSSLDVQQVSNAGTGLTFSLAPQHPVVLALSARQSKPVNAGVTVRPDNMTIAARDLLGLLTPGQAAIDPKLGFEPWLRRREHLHPPVHVTPGYKLTETDDVQVGDSGRFWVIATSDDHGDPVDRLVDARVIYSGKHCNVMLDNRSGKTEETRGIEMGQVFDEQIYQTDTRLFGEPVGSAAGPVTLLISPDVGDFGRDTTIGYFTIRDLEPAGHPQADPHGNHRPMLYIASNVVTRGRSADYLGTLAHEFQHLINASHKLAGGATTQEDVWLDEGLSMYAMQANGYGLGAEAGVLFDHVQTYLRHSDLFSLTDWDQNPDASAYGAVYLFVTYLADRFGEEILSELVNADEAGIANVQARLTKRQADFANVFGDWVAANLLDGTPLSTDSRFHYKSIQLSGAYGRRRLKGVSVLPVNLPNSGLIPMLPYSATYLLMQGNQAGTYRLNVTGTEVFGWLVTPR